MYKNTRYGTDEYLKQDLDKKERAFYNAVIGFVTNVSKMASPDVADLSREIDVLKDLNYEYKQAFEQCGEEYGLNDAK